MVGAEGVPFIPPEQDCKPSELCPENDSACLHSCHAGRGFGLGGRCQENQCCCEI